MHGGVGGGEGKVSGVSAPQHLAVKLHSIRTSPFPIGERQGEHAGF